MGESTTPSPQTDRVRGKGRTAKRGDAGAGKKNGSIRKLPSAARWPARKAYAALDLGTNNCRLLIAKPSADGFVVIDAFSRVVRLGEGLASSGKLSDAAIDRAIGALSVCSDKLRRRNVTLARSVATEACRRAENGQGFIDRVQRETGIRLDIITAEEEARLAEQRADAEEEGKSVEMRRQSGRLKKEGRPHRPLVMCTKLSKGIPAGCGLK